MKDFSKEIWAYALRNAIEHGKTNSGIVVPKLFQHGLDKKDIGKVMKEINEIVNKVNSMKKEAMEKDFEKYKKHMIEHEEKKEGELPELENAVMGKVITRLAPEPSKYNHIGHALVFMVQYLYAKKYKGKCILRFDDTNPEKSSMEFYNAMLDDLKWLGIKWDKDMLASNDMGKMYELAEKLIGEGNAYVCKCTQEEMKDLREKKKECKCRKSKVEANMKEWKAMLEKKYKEGERILRLKGDMKSNNGVMRDPVIFRIAYAPHFIQKDKYCVWPMYDFENPVEDALNGVTHVIRTNEFELRYELHDYILKLLKMKMPNVREIGRYQITGAETQGRVIREMIAEKIVFGWDDPRLVTIKALRRRGFVPETFVELAQTVGLSKSGGHIDFSVLAAANRKIIDPVANRYSFVKNPVELSIANAPKTKEIEMPVHPDKKEKRKIKIGDKVFISKDDFDNLKGKEIRLIHLYNIKLDKKSEFTDEEVKDVPKINWVTNPVKVKVMMDYGEWIEGFGDEDIKNLKVGEVVQFERFGFVRFDNKDKDIFEFWFSHK